MIRKLLKTLVIGSKYEPIIRSLRHEFELARSFQRKTSLNYMFTGPKEMVDLSFEKTELNIFEQYAKKVNFVIDIGANYGYYSIYAANMGKKVIAFEPLTRNLDYLYKNIHDNKMDNLITVYPIGLNNECKVLPIYGNSTGASLLSGWGNNLDSNFKYIQTNKLDSLAEIKIVDCLLKIDVEGLEFEVIKGAYEKFKNGKNITILMEVSLNDHRKEKNVNYVKTFELMKKLGFKWFPIKNPSLECNLSDVEKYYNTNKATGHIDNNYLFIKP